MVAPILKSNHTFFYQILHPQFLHGPNLLTFSSSAFRPPYLIPMQKIQLEDMNYTLGARILEEKEKVVAIRNEELVGKKRGHPTKVKLHPPSFIIRSDIHQAMTHLIFVCEVGKLGGNIWLWGANQTCIVGIPTMKSQFGNTLSYMWPL